MSNRSSFVYFIVNLLFNEKCVLYSGENLVSIIAHFAVQKIPPLVSSFSLPVQGSKNAPASVIPNSGVL